MNSRARIGVLSLQGDFARHLELLAGLGADAVGVRRASELDALDGLVLPGGESTTLYKLMDGNELLDALSGFARERGVLGTCAGMILMARRLEDAGGVEALDLLDIDVRRNGYGRQIDSFEQEITVTDPALAADGAASGVFIRAPRVLRVGESVEVLAVHRQEPVAVRQGRHVALSFHPELLGDGRWHREWLARLA